MAILEILVVICTFPILNFASKLFVGADHVLTSEENLCRCFPGEICWPTKDEWSTFNQSIGGNLVFTVPIGSVCHHELFNAQKCTDLQNAWHAPETHIESSHSIMAPFWANMSCDPFLPRDSRCIVGTYVQYAVNATRIEDFQTTVVWARERNLRLVVRNTGHDYIGKSTGAGTLSIWTHYLKSFNVIDHASSYYTGKAIKVGAGVEIEEANTMAHAQRLTVVGGNCPTVGLAGGFTQGGGFGLLTSRYGFGAQQVLQWEVVTTSGDVLLATPELNSDLYWALSGGGGGTYGVVFSMTVKAYAEETTSAVNLSFSSDGIPLDTYYEAVKVFHDCLPALTDAGGVAIYSLQNTSFSLASSMGPNISKEAMDHILSPVILKLDALSITYQYTSLLFPSYLDAYQTMVFPTPTSEFQAGNRIFPSSILDLNPDGLIETLRGVLSYGTVIGCVAYKAPKSTLPNSMNPMLENGMLSFTVGTVWSNTDWNLNLQNQDLMTNLLQLFDQLTAENVRSAYLNEGNSKEKNWQQVFYGSSYNKLREVKRKYDPYGILWGRTTVGSEAWVERGDGRLCYKHSRL